MLIVRGGQAANKYQYGLCYALFCLRGAVDSKQGVMGQLQRRRKDKPGEANTQ